MSSRSYEGGAAGRRPLFGDETFERVVEAAERVEDVWPDEDLDRRREEQHRDRDDDGDGGRGEQLVPLAAATGDQPGGERQEQRGQLDQRVREDAEDQFEPADVELERKRRPLQPEEQRLGAEREQ